MSEYMQLKNGTRVHLVPFEGTNAVTFLVLCRVGSRYEYEEINGAAHFIEHLMFKGTKRRPTTLDISKELDAIGAEYNAYTAKNMTGYYVKADANHLDLAADLLHDMLFHSKYEQEEVDRERGVIIEEINMYHDNPMMHVETLIEEALFDGNTLGWDIAGSHETMKGMSREQVIDFRDKYYVPSRMVVAVAGKINDNVKVLLEQTFGSVEASAQEPASYEPYEPTTPETRPVRLQTKDTQQVQLALGFPSYGVTDDRLAPLSVLSTILGGSMSSRLFISVRERKGLAYFVRSSQSTYDETGNFMIRAGLDKSRLGDATDTIREEIERMKTDGVTDAELKDAKTHTRGRTLLQLEDSSNRATWYAKQELLKGEVKTPEERMQEIDAVTKQQVLDVANDILQEERMRVAAIGPYKDRDDVLSAANLT